MNKLCILALLFSASFCFGQSKTDPAPYAQTITTEDLKKHLFIVADATMEGRATATEGQQKAAAYIQNEFQRIGLQPGNDTSYQQYFNVYRNDEPDLLTGAGLHVEGQAFTLDEHFYVHATNSFPGRYELKEVIVAGSYFPDSLLYDTPVNGKWVILDAKNASQANRLAQRGAAGFFIVSKRLPTKKSVNQQGGQATKALIRPQYPQQILISEEIAKAILKQSLDSMYNGLISITSYKTDITLNIEKNTKILKSSNVIGILPGSSLKDEYVFITAHYDHEGIKDKSIYYGADDNGSGTVSVLELAEAFVKAKNEGNGPKRSIIFMLTSGEENGLWGSAFYVNNPIYPLHNTSAVLNMDMIGRTDSKRRKDYIYVIGDNQISSDLRPISESVNKRYTLLQLDYKYNDPNDEQKLYYRSDHFNFAKNGVPSIFYFSGLHADYHKPSDKPEKINYPLLSKRAQLVFYTAWDIANHDQLLKRDIPLVIEE